MSYDDLSQENPEALTLDGFEDAYIGFATQFSRPALAVYDYEKCVEILMDRDGMDEEEAVEYLSFNVQGAWAGEHTPLILFRQ